MYVFKLLTNRIEEDFLSYPYLKHFPQQLLLQIQQ